MTTKTAAPEPEPVPPTPLPEYGDTDLFNAPPLKKVIEPEKIITPEIVKEVDNLKTEDKPSIWPW